MINKFFAIFIAIVFICCVFAYGSSERFSFEKWIDNVTSIADMTSIHDVVDCWTKNSYKRDFSHCPLFIEGYVKNSDGSLRRTGELRLAYEFKEVDGGVSTGAFLTKRYSYVTLVLYNEDGSPLYNPYSTIFADNSFPCVTGEDYVYFEDYEGDEPVLQMLDSILAFFKRLYRTVVLLVQILIDAFKNLDLLLPWNATVPI